MRSLVAVVLIAVLALSVGCQESYPNSNQTIITISRASYNQSIGNGALDVYLSIDNSRLSWDKFDSIKLEICCQKQSTPVTIYLTKGKSSAKFLALKPKEAFIYELVGIKAEKSFSIEKRWFFPQEYLGK